MTACRRTATGSVESTHEIDLVTTSGCHFCVHAREVLGQLGTQFRIRVREVALESAEGAVALQRWRVPFPPIVLVDGELFGYGRISERKLRRRLSTAER